MYLAIQIHQWWNWFFACVIVFRLNDESWNFPLTSYSLLHLVPSRQSLYLQCTDWFRKMIMRLLLMPLKHDNWNPIIFHMRKYAKYYNIWHVYHCGIKPAIRNRGLIFWSLDILSSLVLQTRNYWFGDNGSSYLHVYIFNSTKC